METLSHLAYGLSVALQPQHVLLASVGVILGIIIGVLPGLGGTNGVAILLPLTFALGPTGGIIFLASIYWGAIFGGAITSILFNIPGEPWSVATTFDGYPLARQGRAAHALTASFTASFIGAIVSIVLFTFFAPLLAEFALKFGPPENFAVMLLAFASFAGLSGANPAKSILMTLLGLLLATMGFDVVTGRPRMNFGLVSLLGGVNFVVIAIGLFGLGEILLTVEQGLRLMGIKARINWRAMVETWRAMWRMSVTIIRSTLIGFWLGILPGTGATPSSFLSYGLAKSFSKRPESFGKGELEGVVAPEAANNAAGIGALLPLITLGIPGSPTAAVMLAGLLIWGLRPGPLLFTDRPDFVWGLIGSMYVANILTLVLIMLMMPVFASILRIPFAILAPLIVIFSGIGAYATNNQVLDLWLMLGSGVAGYFFKKLDYPLAPLVVALVLGDMMEQSMRQALLMGQGNPAIFITRPITAGFLAASLFLFLLPALRALYRRGRLATAPREAAAREIRG